MKEKFSSGGENHGIKFKHKFVRWFGVVGMSTRSSQGHGGGGGRLKRHNGGKGLVLQQQHGN
jgi:hypothetical protein